MKKQSRVVRVVKGAGNTFLNVPGWLGINSLKEPTKELIKQGKTIYSVPKSQRKETFEQAMERLNLTEQDLKQRKHYLHSQAFLSGAMALLVFIYGLYLLWNAYWLVSLIALGVMMLSLIKLCQARFWLTQIKKRRLGLSFKQWLFKQESD